MTHLFCPSSILAGSRSRPCDKCYVHRLTQSGDAVHFCMISSGLGFAMSFSTCGNCWYPFLFRDIGLWATKDLHQCQTIGCCQFVCLHLWRGQEMTPPRYFEVTNQALILFSRCTGEDCSPWYSSLARKASLFIAMTGWKHDRSQTSWLGLFLHFLREAWSFDLSVSWDC